MRLLDHVVQCTAPFIVREDCGTLWTLTGPKDFARELDHCPLRYVLADELVRVCTELAYSEGDGLSGCLDLIHFPAERLWIEWNAAPQLEELARAVLSAWGSGEICHQTNQDAPHEAKILHLSSEKARAELGWETLWSFERTAVETVAWYRAVNEGGSPADTARNQIHAYMAERT